MALSTLCEPTENDLTLQSNPSIKFTFEHAHKPGTRFGKFATKTLGAMQLPTLEELAAAGESVGKLDRTRSWLALEYCVITLIEHATNNPQALEILSGPRAIDFIRESVDRSWHTYFVAAWFVLGSFKRRWTGIMSYIANRLSEATLSKIQAKYAPAIIAALRREQSLNLFKSIASSSVSSTSHTPDVPLEDECDPMMNIASTASNSPS